MFFDLKVFGKEEEEGKCAEARGGGGWRGEAEEKRRSWTAKSAKIKHV